MSAIFQVPLLLPYFPPPPAYYSPDVLPHKLSTAIPSRQTPTDLPQRTLVRTFASKGNGTPYRFQAQEAPRTLVSGDTRSCAFDTSRLSFGSYGGRTLLFSARPPSFGTHALAH